MVTNSMNLINGWPGVVAEPYPPAVIPLTEFEQDCLPAAVTVESPKVTEFPFEEIVINSITLVKVGDTYPPAVTPRVDDVVILKDSRPEVETSPKSCASPVDAMVT